MELSRQREHEAEPLPARFFFRENRYPTRATAKESPPKTHKLAASAHRTSPASSNESRPESHTYRSNGATPATVSRPIAGSFPPSKSPPEESLAREIGRAS